MAEQGVGCGFIDLLTKGHGAKTNKRDMQVALTELNSFHVSEFKI